jgi:hypothetical protein
MGTVRREAESHTSWRRPSPGNGFCGRFTIGGLTKSGGLAGHQGSQAPRAADTRGEAVERNSWGDKAEGNRPKSYLGLWDIG